MKRILDKAFKYTPSHSTDINKTFTRIRKEQQERERKDADNQREAVSKIAARIHPKKAAA